MLCTILLGPCSDILLDHLVACSLRLANTTNICVHSWPLENHTICINRNYNFNWFKLHTKMWYLNLNLGSFEDIQNIICICTYASRYICCTCLALWCLKRYQEPLLQQCIFGIRCGYDGDHHRNELVSSCTGEFCYSGYIVLIHLVSVIPLILILWLFLGFIAACSTIPRSWCDRFRRCSQSMVWRSETGQILNTYCGYHSKEKVLFSLLTHPLPWTLSSIKVK